MSKLTKILAPLVAIGGLSGSIEPAYSAERVKVEKFLGWEKITVTQTLPVIVPQKVVYKDACGNRCVGINYKPAEMIVGRCTTIDWKAGDSIPGRAWGLLNDISRGIERSVSPRPATVRPCLSYDRCSSIYIAPVPGCCDTYPTFGPNLRLEPIPARSGR